LAAWLRQAKLHNIHSSYNAGEHEKKRIERKERKKRIGGEKEKKKEIVLEWSTQVYNCADKKEQFSTLFVVQISISCVQSDPHLVFGH